MFSGLLIPNNKLSEFGQSLDNYLRINTIHGEHTLFIVSHQELPTEIKNRVKLVQYVSNIESKINHYMRQEIRLIDFTDPEKNRKLSAIRSRLEYFISETLGVNDFYFTIKRVKNEYLTRRYYTFNLMYKEIPCYVLDTDDYLDNLNKVANTKRGTLLLSTYSLENFSSPDGNLVPRWYIRESIRDMIELKEIEMNDRVMIEGFNTRELYIFDRNEYNVLDEIFLDLVDRIRTNILNNISLKIFPRNTPSEYILSKQLVMTPRKQWTIPYPIPDNAPFLHYMSKLAISFETLGSLMLFLITLRLLPTYPFIEKELKIYIKTNDIEVIYSTNYLKDYIRVMTASRVKSNEEFDKSISIDYPNLGPRKSTEESITFYDSENKQPVVLSTKDTVNKIPVPNLEVKDYSLATRIGLDISL
jgi:hypothetical protein